MVLTQSIISRLHSFHSITLADVLLFTKKFSAIANQESLSVLETEMRKLEGLVAEIVDELGYLKKREERFTADVDRPADTKGPPGKPSTKSATQRCENKRHPRKP